MTAGLGGPLMSFPMQQRLAFLLASLDSSDAADRAQHAARELLGSINSRSQARQALHEVLKGLDDCSKHAARLRLQLALLPLLNSIDLQQLFVLLPSIMKQVLTCLSAHRRDAAATQALASFAAAVVGRLVEDQGSGSTACEEGADEGGGQHEQGPRLLHDEVLLPLLHTTYRDPEPGRVAAGCRVLMAALGALASVGHTPQVAAALQSGLAAALEHMWASSSAKQVAAAYIPLRLWVTAVGGAALGAEGARRLAAICCRGASDKVAWQVRREALQTLAVVLITVQADAAMPGAELGSGTTSSSWQQGPDVAQQSVLQGVCVAASGSGAMQALISQRQQVLFTLEGSRYDQIAAVRVAAAEARAAALKLPEPAPMASSSGVRDAAAGTAAASAPPSANKWHRTPLKAPAVISASAAHHFQRPKPQLGELLDFGVQVFAPPSPTRHRQQQEQQQRQDDASPRGTHDDQDVRRQQHVLRRSVDAASQAGGLAGGDWALLGGPDGDMSPPWLRHVQGLHDGAPRPLISGGGGGVVGSPDTARLEVAHHVHGRVEIVYGTPADMGPPREGGVHVGAEALHGPGPMQQLTAPADSQIAGVGMPGTGASPARGQAAIPAALAGSPVGEVVSRVLQRALSGGMAAQQQQHGTSPCMQQTQLQRVLFADGEQRGGELVQQPTGMVHASGSRELAALAAEAGGTGAAAPQPARPSYQQVEGQQQQQRSALDAGGGMSRTGSRQPSRAASSGSLADALAVVRQANSRVGGLLHELSTSIGSSKGGVGSSGKHGESNAAGAGTEEAGAEATEQQAAAERGQLVGEVGVGSVGEGVGGPVADALSQLRSRLDSLQAAAGSSGQQPGGVEDGGAQAEAVALHQLRSSMSQLHTAAGLLRHEGDLHDPPQPGHQHQRKRWHSDVEQQQQQEGDDAGDGVSAFPPSSFLSGTEDGSSLPHVTDHAAASPPQPHGTSSPREHPPSAAGGLMVDAWNQGMATLSGGSELLMALSWRLQRLARGFGPLQQVEGRQAQLGTHTAGMMLASGSIAGGEGFSPLRHGSVGWGSPGRATSGGAWSPAPDPALAGGAEALPQSLDGQAEGPLDLGLDLHNFQLELAQYAQQPLALLSITDGGAALAALAGQQQQGSTGGVEPSAADAGDALPPAALVMLQEQREEEAERRAWQLCNEQVDFIVRSSGGGYRYTEAAVSPEPTAPGSACVASNFSTQRYLTLQRAAAAQQQQGAWSPGQRAERALSRALWALFSREPLAATPAATDRQQ